MVDMVSHPVGKDGNCLIRGTSFMTCEVERREVCVVATVVVTVVVVVALVVEVTVVVVGGVIVVLVSVDVVVFVG